MSGLWSMAAAVVVAAGASVYAADQNRKAAHRGQDMQRRQAEEALRQRQIDFKRQNQKEVDVGGLQKDSLNAPAGTLLTGSEGVDYGGLPLGGRNQLLGG